MQYPEQTMLARCKYGRSDLLDIMETVSVSISGWATITTREETGEGMAKAIGLVDDDGDARVILLNDLQRAINKIVAGKVQINSEVRGWIASGDVGMIDAEAADCIAQVACFGELVYG